MVRGAARRSDPAGSDGWPTTGVSWLLKVWGRPGGPHRGGRIFDLPSSIHRLPSAIRHLPSAIPQEGCDLIGDLVADLVADLVGPGGFVEGGEESWDGGGVWSG